MVPAIVVAKICSRYAVLTTSSWGHAIEESLWAASALAIAWAAWQMRDGATPPVGRVFSAIAVSVLACALYMVAVDVPMYASRALAELQQVHAPPALAKGLTEVATRLRVSHR